jgi:hypothetical protein
MKEIKQYTPYSEKIAEEICVSVATTSSGLKRLCAENPHWPRHVNIYKWCHEREDFRSRYARAKAAQIEWLVEEALDIAYDNSSDTLTDSRGNKKCNNEWVQRSKLKVDTIKWIACKLSPKLYGEKSKVDELSESVLEKLIDKL